MGRQPFLTRLALGRSPFEPSTSASRSPEYVQLDSSQHDVPLEARAPNSNRYIQLFDERGNPINPRAQQHGRQFRRAQNDVLSAIGFLQRRQSSSQDLPGPYEERLSLLETEHFLGETIGQISTTTRDLCTWWLGSIRDRTLAFPGRAMLPFSWAFASEFRSSGTSLLYSGAVPISVAGSVTQQFVATVFHLRPLDRFINAIDATPKTRRFIRRWKMVTNTCFLGCAELLMFPLAYHAQLQRLGMVPSTQWFPSWRSLIPFSATSPLWALPGRQLTDLTVLQLLTAVILSPAFLYCFESTVRRWLSVLTYDAIATSIFRPDNPDMIFYEPSSRLTYKSPSAIRRIVDRLIVTLGWAKPTPIESTEEHQRPSTQPMDAQQTVNDGDNGAIDTDVAAMSTRADTGAQEGEAAWPLSPTVSNTSHDANDPRIRITSRGGVVEMEVQLPSRVISSYAEAIESSPDSGNFGPLPSAIQSPQRYHRVTGLSTRPAESLSAIVNERIVDLVFLPLRFLTIRSIATHYLAGTLGASHMSAGPSLPSILALSSTGWSLESFATLGSRLAMYGLLEVGIHLGVWGLEWVTVTQSGRKLFGWGSL